MSMLMLMVGYFAADLFVGRRPSVATAALLPFRDHAKPPGTPPSSPTFSKSAGARLDPGGLRRPLAVVHQAVGGSHDHRPAESTRRLVSSGESGTPQSFADRDALQTTWKDRTIAALSVEGTGVVSSQSRTRTPADDIGAVSSLATQAIQKVFMF